MAFTAQNVTEEVRRVIHDEIVTYRWSDDELIDYINAATRQIVSILPDANTIETIETMTASQARQVLPAGGIKFIKVARNYNDGGSQAEGPIRYVEKDALDTFDPDWEYDTTIKSAGTANFFEHYCHDPREPDVYYMYPPSPTGTKRAAIVYSATPTEITVLGDTVPLGDEYRNAIVQYTVYRALTKESRETLPDAFRQELWQNFIGALGLQSQAEQAVTAKNHAPPDGD